MSRRALRSARLLRGLVVAATGAALGVAGHLAGGGPVPAMPALLGLVALAAAACTVASDRQWSFTRLMVALSGIQLLVHLTMCLGMSHGGATGQPAAVHGSQVGAGAAPGLVMLAGHAGAAAVMAWLLRHGEELFVRGVERLRRRTPWPTLAAAADLLGSATAPRGSRATWALHPLSGSLARRGPPAPAAA